MRKEFIIAIVSGITIGLVVAFGIWRANCALKSTELTNPQTETVTVQKEGETKENIGLSIISPEENDVISTTPIVISGATKPGGTLVISGEQKDYIIEVPDTGSFEEDVDLVSGVNEIIIAYSENGDSVQTQSIKVIYSTEFEKEDSE